MNAVTAIQEVLSTKDEAIVKAIEHLRKRRDDVCTEGHCEKESDYHWNGCRQSLTLLFENYNRRLKPVDTHSQTRGGSMSVHTLPEYRLLRVYFKCRHFRDQFWPMMWPKIRAIAKDNLVNADNEFAVMCLVKKAILELS